mgnify:CR=1 FL=1
MRDGDILVIAQKIVSKVEGRTRDLAQVEAGAEAQALAQSLADGPTFAHAMTKRLLHQEWAMDLDSAIEAEAGTVRFHTTSATAGIRGRTGSGAS